jgi:hypothetical protein
LELNDILQRKQNLIYQNENIKIQVKQLKKQYEENLEEITNYESMIVELSNANDDSEIDDIS